MWENCHLKNSNLDYFCEFFKSQMWLKIDGLKMCRLYLFVCWIFWKNVRKLEVILGKINSLWKIYFRLSGSQTLTVKKGGRSVQQIQLFFSLRLSPATEFLMYLSHLWNTLTSRVCPKKEINHKKWLMMKKVTIFTPSLPILFTSLVVIF